MTQQRRRCHNVYCLKLVTIIEELDEDYDLPKLGYLVEMGYDLEYALQHYEDVSYYRGMSLEEVAEELVDDGLFGKIPENILMYFDFEKLAYDLRIDGYYECDEGVFHYC